jgi:peptidoglycan L-alanyl-D-glutamate endopeptidase CwlK
MPQFAAKVRAMSDALLAKGIYIRVTAGYRNFQEQNDLFAQRPKVTNAPGGYSAHNFGLAVDCAPSLDAAGTPFAPDWDGKDAHYAAMVAAGEAEGLNCGANWHGFVDEPHFQWAGIPTTPGDDMRADYYSGGLQLVWSKVLIGDYQ